MEILLLAAIVLFVALPLTDDPNVFRYRSLRFLYRFGFPLYFRVFKVLPRSDKFSIPRWKIEHWMVASGFSEPLAEEDGEGRFVLMEFIGLFRLYRIPLLMRGRISWDNKTRNVVVCGYATWTYFIFFTVFAFMLLMLANKNEFICIAMPLSIYLLWCGAVYIKQSQRLHSIGEQISQYLSSDYQEYRTQR
jgi:hypothetical protein